MLRSAMHATTRMSYTDKRFLPHTKTDQNTNADTYTDNENANTDVCSNGNSYPIKSSLVVELVG
jgi:hypothetical protein